MSSMAKLKRNKVRCNPPTRWNFERKVRNEFTVCTQSVLSMKHMNLSDVQKEEFFKDYLKRTAAQEQKQALIKTQFKTWYAKCKKGQNVNKRKDRYSEFEADERQHEELTAAFGGWGSPH